MTGSEDVQRILRLYLGTPGGDVEHAEAIYHENAVLEFPQSRERFEGRDQFTAWRGQYPANISFDVQRVTIRDELAVVELAARYDDGPTMFGVSILEFQAGKVAVERIYVGEGWEPPEWRAPWRAEWRALDPHVWPSAD